MPPAASVRVIGSGRQVECSEPEIAAPVLRGATLGAVHYWTPDSGILFPGWPIFLGGRVFWAGTLGACWQASWFRSARAGRSARVSVERFVSVCSGCCRRCVALLGVDSVPDRRAARCGRPSSALPGGPLVARGLLLSVRADGASARISHDGTPGRLGSRAGPSALAARACRPGPGARPGCRAWFAPTGVARGQVRGHRNLPVDRQVSRPAAGDGRTGRRATASPPARGQVLRHRNLPVDRQVSRPAAGDGRTGRRATASPPVRGQVLRHRNLPVDRQVSRPAVGDGRAGRQASAPPDAPRSAPARGPSPGAGSGPAWLAPSR